MEIGEKAEVENENERPETRLDDLGAETPRVTPERAAMLFEQSSILSPVEMQSNERRTKERTVHLWSQMRPRQQHE